MSHICIVAGYSKSLVKFRGPLIRALLDSGHQVTAIGGDEDADVATQVSLMGATLVHVPIERTGMNPVRDLISLINLFRTFRRLKPDVVLGYTAKPVIYGSLAAWLAGVKKRTSLITGLGYLFSAGNTGFKLSTWVGKRLYKMALAVNHVVIFQNIDDQQEFLDTGLVSERQNTCVVNGSGVDLEYYSPKPAPTEAVFLMIARLLVDKGIREYAEAASIVRQQFPAARCLLVGWLDDNPDSISQPELDGWVQSGAIEYIGFQEDVRSAIAESSVFVLPSYREGTPRTVLEAMAMKRAIITTDAPGCRQTIVHGESGYLVPVREAQAVADAMIELLQRPDRITHMAQKAYERVVAVYDVNKVNRDIMAALELVSLQNQHG